MTTDRPRRRRPAQAARRLVGGASTAAVLALVAAWSATTEPPTALSPASADVRVVITDPAIDTDTAIAAALDAAARGIDRVAVPVAGTSSQHVRQVPDATHSTTRAS